MRWSKAITAMIVAGCAALAMAAEPSLSDLKTRAESARPEERPPLYIGIARMQLHNADELYNDGNIEQARAAVEDVVSYSQKASDSAMQSKKHLKDVEIVVRKMAEKLRDIKRTLNLEDQPPVDAAVKRLEDIRTGLLEAMFRKEKK
jgi:soluble cytochrome b562